MLTRYAGLPGLATLLLTGCASGPSALEVAEAAVDVHSYSRPHEVQVTHVALDLRLDFENKQVHGLVDLYLERLDPSAPLVLDTAGLVIEEVTGPGGSERSFEIGPTDPILGTPLTIELLAGDNQVRVRYHTNPDAAALQWLEPAQTRGGTKPFLYTQGQAILTRSWIPIQDSPGVRVTYQARVEAPTDLVVVMSAESGERTADGSFAFSMSKQIPPYLIAMACGDLAKRDISNRCAVWAEPDLVDAAAAELEDTEAMVQAGEELFGAYRWGRYDVLILPPAFPFGGMENPCLTFATPTILAGDKSLVGLVAHELAHSWSGNLVTNATWRDFWLNEGFTTYLESRIMERVYGRDRANMEILLGMQGLDQQLQTLPSAEQILHIDLTGRNPDDGMTAVAYEKGAAFLRRLEQAYGRPTLDRFLATYFDSHAFQSMTTDRFLIYLQEHLLDGVVESGEPVDVDWWVHGTGLPDDAPRPTSTAFAEVDEQRREWIGGRPAADLDTEGWVTQQWLHFLNRLPDDANPTRMAELDQSFQLTESRNSEILAAWFALSIRNGYEPAMPYLRQFLATVGRRKFLSPLYTELVATEDGKAMALEMYAEFRPLYHSISTRGLDQLLGWRR